MSYGIRADGDASRKTYFNGKNFGAWSTKVFAALDEADALRITQRKETIPVEVLPALDALGNVNNQAQMDENVADLRDFGKRFKRCVSFIDTHVVTVVGIFWTCVSFGWSTCRRL